MPSVLERARGQVHARIADSLGLRELPQVQMATGPRGAVPTVARCLDALYRMEGGLTVGQWCIMRTLVCTLLDHLDGNLDGDGLPGTLPLVRMQGPPEPPPWDESPADALDV